MKKKRAVTSSLQNKAVVMSNVLSRAAQNLNLTEKRLMFAAVAKMGNNVGGEVIIHASEYAETFNLPVKQAYEQMKEASESFFNRYFTLSVPDRKGEMKWKIRWLQKSGYNEGEARVGLQFTEDTLPYLVDLTREFTKYRLSQACALRSIHSWRLLELFESESRGQLFMTIDQFCESMEASESCRKNFAQLKRKIIEPAIKELHEKDSWCVTWEPVKRGRKVMSLKFFYEKDKGWKDQPLPL